MSVTFCSLHSPEIRKGLVMSNLASSYSSRQEKKKKKVKHYIITSGTGGFISFVNVQVKMKPMLKDIISLHEFLDGDLAILTDIKIS